MLNKPHYTFIGGIPASGKSYLAKKIATKLNILHIDLDDLREEMAKDPKLEPWVNFFWRKDEENYWNSVNCELHWNNLLKQSEVFWPTIKKKINEIIKFGRSTIFECINIMPHLAKRDLKFPGIYLLGKSFKLIFERIKKEPRWGKTEDLQKIEAKFIFKCEGARYKVEAEKYGYKTFNNLTEAEKELIRLMED